MEEFPSSRKNSETVKEKDQTSGPQVNRNEEVSIPQVEISPPEEENSNIDSNKEDGKLNCEYCEFECTDQNDMMSHNLNNHEIEQCREHKCDNCDESFIDENKLKDHVELVHSATEILCGKCDYKTTDQELFTTHERFSHEPESPATENYACGVCDNLFGTKSILDEHVKLHSAPSGYMCEVCAHESSTNEDMDQHKLLCHQTPSLENAGNVTNHEDEDIVLKKKLRIMEESYDRLMNMFLKQQNENKDKALAFKVEIEAATESFRVAKAENEKLKEVNEVQHKLWKIFVDKFEKVEKPMDTKPNNNPDKKAGPSTHKSTDDEEIVIEDEIDLDGSYEEWLKDTRSRGFKRTSPTSNPEKNEGNGNQSEAKKTKKTFVRTEPTPDEPARVDFIKYCHNWNNYGKCTFQNCRFAHENAPLCKFDGDCKRQKCLFSHMKQNMHFLASKSKPSHVPMHSWPSMIPPWSTPFPFNPSPWQQNHNTNRKNQN